MSSISMPNQSASMSNTNESTLEFNRYDLKVNWDELNAKLALDELTNNIDEVFPRSKSLALVVVKQGL